MAKKIVLALVIAMLVAGGAFAQDFKMSAGVGGYFDLNFRTRELSGISTYIDTKIDDTNLGVGGYAFFDATYVEVVLGYLESNTTTTTTINNVSKTNDDKFTYNFLQLGVYGKYPIALTDKVSLFPMVGIEYMMFSYAAFGGVKYTYTNYSNSDMSNLWVKAGVGFDISFTDQIYMRIEALYGISFNNKYEEDYRKVTQELVDLVGGNATYNDGLTNGVTAKLAVGYKF